MRVQTTLTAYVGYLVKMVWPIGLAVPVSAGARAGRASGRGLRDWRWLSLRLAVSTCAARLSLPAVGWFWYLGMLVPVIGLITIGDQAMADRYTYLPLVGIFLAVVWGGAELLNGLQAIYGTTAWSGTPPVKFRTLGTPRRVFPLQAAPRPVSGCPAFPTV